MDDFKVTTDRKGGRTFNGKFQQLFLYVDQAGKGIFVGTLQAWAHDTKQLENIQVLMTNITIIAQICLFWQFKTLRMKRGMTVLSRK